MADEGKVTPIEPGLIARITAGFSSIVQSWLPPGNPPEQTSPKGSPVRDFDYPVFYNTTYSVRSGELTPFQAMRNLADGFYLLRIALEKRKDQIARTPWQVRLVAKEGETNTKRAARTAADKRIQQLTQMFRYPDGEMPWDTWVRCVVEEMLTTDAVTVLPRKTFGGDVVGLELIDGATIKRVIDETGRTPQPPYAAYQQMIHGGVNANLTRDEVVYMPRNRRVNKVYGYSPVEQLVFIINIAIRRAIFQLNFYTEGNIPEGICQVPSDWSLDDVKRFQAWFDAMMSGNLKKRRRMIFLPGSGKASEGKSSLTFPKLEHVKDETDEWIARVIAWCLSLPPTALVKSNNRATAEQADDTASAEGLIPSLTFIENLLNFIIQRPEHMNMADIEFAFTDMNEEDTLTQAQVDEIHVRNGIKSIDEIREREGLEAIGVDRPCLFSTDGTAITPIDAAFEAGEAMANRATEDAINPPEPVLPAGAAGVPSGKTPPKGSQKNADARQTRIAFESKSGKAERLRQARRAAYRKPAP